MAYYLVLAVVAVAVAGAVEAVYKAWAGKQKGEVCFFLFGMDVTSVALQVAASTLSMLALLLLPQPWSAIAVITALVSIASHAIDLALGPLGQSSRT